MSLAEAVAALGAGAAALGGALGALLGQLRTNKRQRKVVTSVVAAELRVLTKRIESLERHLGWKQRAITEVSGMNDDDA